MITSVYPGQKYLDSTECSKSDRQAIEDEPRSARPSTSTEELHVDKVTEIPMNNRRVIVREIADDVSISLDTDYSVN